VNAAADLDAALCGNLGPPRMLTEASGSRERFLARYGDTQLLVVKLAPGLDMLEGALSALESAPQRRVQPSVRVMGFETQSLTEEQLQSLELDVPDRGTELLRIDRLRWMFGSERHHVVPLRKRTDDATFLDRISLGRATNKDIVLRHATVSKFHAWFEMGDTGELYVADSDSTNGSTLNGKPLPPRELTRVQPGDHLRFGSVECVACEPADFWRAIRTF
jgi:hypothetical protein